MKNGRVPLSKIIRTALCLVAALGFIGIRALQTASAAEIPTVAPEREGFSPERLARLNAKMHGYVDQGSTAGVITLIARHGKIVHFDVYGKADIEASTPMKFNSLFRMYSMTKPVTSTPFCLQEGTRELHNDSTFSRKLRKRTVRT